jgi:hypothetical protein
MRLFEEKDIETINGWYRARQQPELNKYLFPDTGFFIENVAVGFLYRTDSCLCFLDGYVCSPSSTKEQRAAAFEKITHMLIRVAKDQGYTRILAYTKSPGIKKIAERFQFSLKGDYTLFIKEI